MGHHFSPDEKGGVYNGFITKPQEVIQYTDEVIAAMESGWFSYVAHPDLYMRRYPSFDETAGKSARRIIEKSNELGIPLEYNLLGITHGKNDGMQGYPHPDFWRLAGKLGATAVIGIDAHDPKAYLDLELHENAEKTLNRFGVKQTDKIKFLR